MDRTLWLKNVLEVVAEFASEEFQQAAWVEFNGPDGATFEEACCLLDDYALEDALISPSNPYRLKQQEKRVLFDFLETLEDYSENIYELKVLKHGEHYASAAKIISQPEWEEVRHKALIALRYFKEIGFPEMPRLLIFDRNKVEQLKGYWEV